MKANCLLISLIVLSLSALISQGAVVQGIPLTLTYEATGSGTLNGVPFDSSPFQITAEIDASQWMESTSDIWTVPHASASVSILGVGSFQFLTPTRTFATPSAVGFARGNQAGGLDLLNLTNNPEVGSWSRVDPIGPIAGNGRILQWTRDPVIQTSGGTLEFASVRPTPVTFTATPEPSGFSLLVLGSIGLLVRRRR